VTLRALLAATALAAAACSSRAPAAAAGPADTPRATVSEFLQAAADSNLTRMAELWGTSRGPASKTRQPDGWERRIVIMQAYLRGTTHRVVAENRGANDSQRIVHVELRREECAFMVPFTTVRSNGRWLVGAFDLGVAGVPGRPGCGERPSE
jgi:hypothetical protein